MADKDTPPKLPEFQCRVFGYNPVPRCARPAAPTPNPNSRSGDGGQQAAPAGRSDCGSLWDQNAGRSADQRCWVDAPRARVNG
jgi:hypothetical protein